MSKLAAFIIGSGPNVGKHTAAALKAHGYRVALGSRNPAREQLEKDGYFPVTLDIEDPESIKAAFAAVNEELGPPSVVVFNGGLREVAPIPEDPLSLSFASLTRAAGVGLAVFAAAQGALPGFRSEALKDVPKTFIITGNPLPWVPDQLLMVPGVHVQKLIEWRLAEQLSLSYSRENIRFYYATMVGPSGGITENTGEFFTSGLQVSKVYLDLVTRKDQANWDHRYTIDGKKWTKE